MMFIPRRVMEESVQRFLRPRRCRIRAFQEEEVVFGVLIQR